MSDLHPPGAPALELRGISKHFGSVVALDDVSLEVGAGRVHALLGENGAGKSTLMRVAYGLLQADAGRVRIHGEDVRHHDTRAAIARGLGMVHQQPTLVPTLTAAENVVLGGRGRLDLREAATMMTRLADDAGLHVRPDTTVAALSVVEQQRLGILKALAGGARVLILDEPTSVLPPAEIARLLEWIRSFAARGGTVILITHKLREALAVADAITVLRRGRVTYEGSPAGQDEVTLARAMFPDASEVAIAPVARTDAGPTVARARNLAVRDAAGVVRIRNATFELRRHEVVGVAAVEGAGHRELLAALARVTPVEDGLELPQRIAVVPADRVGQALIPAFDLAENVALRDAGAARGLMRWSAVRERTSRLISDFDIATPGPSVQARTLSGGNQQRLVIARALEHDLDLLVADNPTTGLDLRATAFVHEQLRRAAARGAAVVVHSSDLDELLALADRVLVVFDGTVRDVGTNRDVVGRAMLGAA